MYFEITTEDSALRQGAGGQIYNANKISFERLIILYCTEYIRRIDEYLNFFMNSALIWSNSKQFAFEKDLSLVLKARSSSKHIIIYLLFCAHP